MQIRWIYPIIGLSSLVLFPGCGSSGGSKGHDVSISDTVPNDTFRDVSTIDTFGHDVSIRDRGPAGSDIFDETAGVDACLLQCTGKQCGDNGCGGSCGTCKDGKTCQSGKCVCTPHTKKDCCGSNVCWFDSCGNVGDKVSDCQYGCTGGQCATCPTADCTGKQCGDNGCGGSCGQCNAQDSCDGLKWTPPRTCQNGKCVGAAPQDCEDHNPCTIDSCVPGKGCTYQETANGQTCGTGSCVGLSWTAPGTCNSGTCEPGSVQSCNDGLDLRPIRAVQ